MPTIMQLADRRVSAHKESAIVMIKMCMMSEIKLDTLSLWMKLQAYHFFLTEDERKEVDALGSWADRLNVTPEVYAEGLQVLKGEGFIQSLGGHKTRLLRAREWIKLRKLASEGGEDLMSPDATQLELV